MESQNEEKTESGTGRRTRKCKQWTPGSYAAIHKGKLKEKKEKKQTKQDEQKSQKRIILEYEIQKNKKKITKLEAEIDILAAQIDENDQSRGLNNQQPREIAELKTKVQQIQERESQHLTEINSLQQKWNNWKKTMTKLTRKTETWKWKSVRPQNNGKSLSNQRRQLLMKKPSRSRLLMRKPKKSPGSKANWKAWKTDRTTKVNHHMRECLSSSSATQTAVTSRDTWWSS